MPAKSHYDQLHDRYHQIRTTKSGTRYEILAAVVFAAYEQDAVVIHDLRLIGDDSGVPHQIDVVVERAGRPFRVLIECKDYDVSGDDVGLAIVRDFYGVVDDVHPHAAWIITCNGFTADARAYAKAKGIRLATLRLFQDADWSNGRINTIGVDFTFFTPEPGMILTLKTVNEADQAPILAGLPPSISLDQVDHTELHDGQRTRSLADILRALIKQPVLPGSSRHVEARTDLDDAWFSPNGCERYPIVAYEVGYRLRIYPIEMHIETVRSAARLLLLDDEGLDFIVWEDTLSAYSITDEGRVIAPPPAAEQRVRTTITDKR